MDLAPFITRWLDPSIVLRLEHAPPLRGTLLLLDTIALSLDSERNAEALSARVLASARSHAETMPGRERYALRAERNGATLASSYFELGPSEGNQEREAPSVDRQIVMSSMRHAEDSHRSLLDAHSALYGHLVAAMKEQRLELADARKERIELYALAQTLMDRRQSRELEVRSVEQGEKRMERGMTILEGFARTVGPAITKSTPVHRLLGSLSEEQQATILGCLNQQQVSALLEISDQGKDAEQASVSIKRAITDDGNGAAKEAS